MFFTRRLLAVSFFALTVLPLSALAQSGNRFTYLDAFLDPYYVSRSFPKLTTPQWVEKRGVHTVVVFAIDDMRDTQKYENYLRPILERLKKIDGRAPVSIMTNRIDPADPQLKRWLAEGLNIDVHTYDHPCPCLQKSDFAAAKETYEKCVDLMSQVPGNRPVAFRMPCCDSLNTPSPRFFAEIFAKTTSAGNYLSIDSSVFQVFTADDPELPESLVLDEEGQPRFRKYIPFESFVNTIENYPYPYIIGRHCWQFPCMAPSDWEAQHLQQPNNPRTVRDMKAALDATVAKQGVFNLVFHPHGWIRNDQVIELIEHAQEKHGDKVLFLNFREALEQLQKRLLGGESLRDAEGADNGVRLLDLNRDGYLDVVIGNERTRKTRIWDPATLDWRESEFPTPLVQRVNGRSVETGVRFGVLGGAPVCLVLNDRLRNAWTWRDGAWVEQRSLIEGLGGEVATSRQGADQGVRLRDLDHDGECELLVANEQAQRVYRRAGTGWRPASYGWPKDAPIVDAQGRDAGARLVDLDGDGGDDLLFSNDQRFGVYLWEKKGGWKQSPLHGVRGDENAIPMIVRSGTNNGAWFHSGHLWVQNEDTHRMPNLVDRRKFEVLLPADRVNFPAPRSPEQSRRAISVPPGLEVELVAAEPLVTDPIAIDWGPDGVLWVAEMGDYPNGVDGSGGSGGRVRRLFDDDGDGRYDRSEVFLDKLNFPTGVKSFREGVLITAAPDILYAEDADGDGRAEKVNKLYSGFAPGNQQHRVNGLRWGLDNWLYLANGDSGGTVFATKAPDKKLDIRGRDLKIDPDTHRISALAGQTQYGRNRDDWGHWFGGNNSNPMWQYVLEDDVTRRNPHIAFGGLRQNVFDTPGAAPVFPRSRTLARFNDFNKSNRFTSACSPIVYRDDWLGAAYANNVFVCEPVHNLVHREVTRWDGAIMRSRRAGSEVESEFLASSDNWFRPTMARTGPDGALWVVDMYRFVIEHPEWIPQAWQEQLELRAGHDRGRIYRVVRRDAEPRSDKPLAGMNTAELVAALESRNGTRRDMAHQQLIWRDDRAAAPLLAKQLREATLPQTRVHALSVLAAWSMAKPADLVTAMHDTHPGVRRWGAIWTGKGNSVEAHPSLRTALIELTDDADLETRMRAAIALGSVRHPSAAEALGRLAATTDMSPYLRAAVLSSVNRDNLAGVIDALAQASLDRERPPETLNSLITMAAAINSDDAWRTVLQTASAADTIPDWTLALGASIAEQLQRRENAWGEHSTRSLFSQLLQCARSDAIDQKQTLSRRQHCIRLLGAVPLEKEANLNLLRGMLTPQSPIELQRDAVHAIGQMGGPESAGILLSDWNQRTPAVRNAILDLLLSRGESSLALLESVREGAVQASSLGPHRRQQLRTHRHPPVREAAEKLFQATTPQGRRDLIARYAEAMKAQGSTQKGRALFVKKCGNCHRMEGVGHELGPDLAALTNRSNSALLIALLDPNASVEDKFQDFVVVTRDGRQRRGILTAESATSVTLLEPEGKRTEVLRRDIDALQSTGKSLMPEGMEKEVSPSEAAHLFAYLRSAGPPPKSFPGNKPRTVTPRDDGSIHLFVTESRIYGPSVVLEEKYRNLGFWESAEDRAVWALRVNRPGRYRVSVDYACADSTAGNRYLVECGGQTLGGVVEASGGWDAYRRMTAGELTLPEGVTELTFRSDGPIKQFLIDLRGVTLRPLHD